MALYVWLIPVVACCLVTIDDHPLTLVVAANDGKTVSVWVGSYHEVSVQLGTKLHTEGHSLSILWVRRNHCWEVAIYNHLLRHYIDVLEAPRTQAERHDNATCAVHGRVNDVEVLLTVDDILVDHCRVNGCHVVVIHSSLT